MEQGNLLQANLNKYQILVMAPQRGDKNAKDTCTLTIDDQQIRPTRSLKRSCQRHMQEGQPKSGCVSKTS